MLKLVKKFFSKREGSDQNLILKEKWIHQLLLSEHDPKGLLELEDDIIISLN